jgi:hypothetical protein
LTGLLHVQGKEHTKVQQPGFDDISNVAHISRSLLLYDNTPTLYCCAKRYQDIKELHHSDGLAVFFNANGPIMYGYFGIASGIRSTTFFN